MSIPNFVDGIEYIHFKKIKAENFYNYELQRDAGIGICKNAFENNRTRYVMCFGYPGTGKSIFAKRLVADLREMGFESNLLLVSCNTLLSKATGTGTIIEELNKTIKIAENNRPMIYVLDELDAITQERLLSTKRENVNEFTQWFMDTFSNDFSKKIKDEGKLAVFAFTNDLQNIDAAVRRRFNHMFHFDLPSDEVLLLMLQDCKILNGNEILSRIKENLFDSKVDGASFMRSCLDCKDEIISEKLSSGDAALALIANMGAHIITPEQERDYQRRLNVNINAANITMRYWRKKIR
ncbi:MAG: hypothetical protein YK1309IOTA_840001 [Marine Group I thaumarchaeote]|nr:MAG: hypothetical protein YK1309IOTA_840001 [Marine Group I thaumarchaeote]